MAVTIAAFYCLGGIAGLLLTLGAGFQGATRPVAAALSLGAFATALVVHRWGSQWPRHAFHIPIVLAALAIDVGVLMAQDAGTAVVAAAVMSFVVFDAYLFFRLRVATVHLLLGVVGVTIALLVQGDVPLPAALALDVVMVALGAASRNLVDRASGAIRDPLTGLHNRRGFDAAIQELLTQLARSGGQFSAALLDLDGFKAINDTQGHEAGDRVLCKVADVFSRALPRRAVFARHGGDEFALLLPGVTGPQALELLRRVCAEHPELRLSGGVSEYAPGDGAAQLMRRADQALYSAKAAGRGRWELDGEVTDDLVRDLAAAVAAGDVQVHLQPLMALGAGAVVGVEALARWDRPGHGPVSPVDFIALAEQHGLIGALGEHVLRSACRQLAELHARTGHRLRLGVNVSGRELCDPGYPARVQLVLEETGWPATETILEVTESVLDADSANAVATLHVLRSLGIAVAIDDFGTGYSSLSRLDTLPADILKIDSSFTATITTSPRRAQMRRSIVGMAGALGLKVIAEGVETAEQHALVRQVGCTYGQGWLYGRPGPLAALAASLDGDQDIVPAQAAIVPAQAAVVPASGQTLVALAP